MTKMLQNKQNIWFALGIGILLSVAVWTLSYGIYGFGLDQGIFDNKNNENDTGQISIQEAITGKENLNSFIDQNEATIEGFFAWDTFDWWKEDNTDVITVVEGMAIAEVGIVKDTDKVGISINYGETNNTFFQKSHADVVNTYDDLKAGIDSTQLLDTEFTDVDVYNQSQIDFSPFRSSSIMVKLSASLGVKQMV